jgi:hypothetical protein
MLVESVHQRAHLIIPQLDRSIMQRRGQEGLLGIWTLARGGGGGLTECDALDPGAFALKLGSVRLSLYRISYLGEHLHLAESPSRSTRLAAS